MVQVAIETIIENLLKQKIGLDASSIGSKTIARAIERRRVICGLPNKSSYLHHLQSSNRELEALIEAVVVPETWFFRDKEPFACLSQYVKTEWQPNNGVLQVLSVPCSTGEEPYSIAITLLDAGLTPAQFCIDAVDISKQALLKAKQAIYSRNSFRGGSIHAQQRYFQDIDTRLEVRPFVRESVNFIPGNILTLSFPKAGKYQIIFCRNLLIYLESNARTKVLQTLDYTLAPGGLLFVGAAETAQVSARGYTSIRHPAAFAYRKENRQTLKQSAIAQPPRQHNKVAAPLANTNFEHAQKSPPISASQLERAKQLADRGHLNEAAVLCESYLSANRTDAQAYILLGEIYQELNHRDRAERSFQKAIYLNPNAYEAIIHLALLKEQRGDLAGASVLRARFERFINMQKQ